MQALGPWAGLKKTTNEPQTHGGQEMTEAHREATTVM